MNREIDKMLSAEWIRSEANVWKGIFMKSDMGIGMVKGLGGDRLEAIAVVGTDPQEDLYRPRAVVGQWLLSEKQRYDSMLVKS